MSQATIQAVVHAMTTASPGTLLVELRPSGGGSFPEAEPGAHVDVHLGPLVRQYSLVDTSDAGRYLICVLAEERSRGGSRHVHRSLRVGDEIAVSAPRNTFALHEAPHTVLAAGGIGITPLLAMAGALHARDASFELHAYAHRRKLVPLLEHVAAQQWAQRLVVHASDEGDSLRSGVPSWLGAPAGTVVHTCGPLGFMEAVAAHAADAGFEVHRELFAAAEPVSLEGDQFAVVVGSSGEQLVVDSGETIAEVLERSGYDVALSCEQGICGSCIVGVLSGTPDHRDEVQTAAEHAANTQINICVSRSKSAVLTLDL